MEYFRQPIRKGKRTEKRKLPIQPKQINVNLSLTEIFERFMVFKKSEALRQPSKIITLISNGCVIIWKEI
ncbi:hypothetical protein [Alteribacillus sp. HJP-4]|uniref:hypothetical protein n=1 Tax=Alteribacillus sp. HJP-4 TaxID=2775394 RepID=UPI0035CCFDE7